LIGPFHGRAIRRDAGRNADKLALERQASRPGESGAGSWSGSSNQASTSRIPLPLFSSPSAAPEAGGSTGTLPPLQSVTSTRTALSPAATVTVTTPPATAEPLCSTELVTSSLVSKSATSACAQDSPSTLATNARAACTCPGHRRDRHAPGIRRVAHNRTALRRPPRPVRRRAQDGCTLHSARPVKPETPAAAARPWPSAETPTVTPTAKTPRAGPLYVRGHRNRPVYGDPR
jgi:hypothetical protein